MMEHILPPPPPPPPNVFPIAEQGLEGPKASGGGSGSSGRKRQQWRKWQQWRKRQRREERAGRGARARHDSARSRHYVELRDHPGNRPDQHTPDGAPFLAMGQRLFTPLRRQLGDTTANVLPNIADLIATAPNAANFTLTVTATPTGFGSHLSAPGSGTKFDTESYPLALTVIANPVAGLQVEHSLSVGYTINGLSGDTNTLQSLVLRSIPVGAIITSHGTPGYSLVRRRLAGPRWMSLLGICPSDDQ